LLNKKSAGARSGWEKEKTKRKTIPHHRNCGEKRPEKGQRIAEGKLGKCDVPVRYC